MAEPEEQMLKEYFEEMNRSVEILPEEQLDAAIHNGMHRGQKRRIILRRGYVGAVLAMVVLALFVFLPWAYQTSKLERTQLPSNNWGELEVYREVVGDNLTISSALDAGLVQHVDVTSPESEGLQMTINGVIMDRRGLILLYTLENHTDERLMEVEFTLKKNKSTLTNLNNTYSAYGSFDENEGSPGISREYRLIPWNSYQETLPNQIYATLSLLPRPSDTPSQRSSVSDRLKMYQLNTLIDLDATAEHSQGRNIELSKSFSIVGQQIGMKKIYVGPTGIYMQESHDDKNTMKIYSLIGTTLVLGQGDQEENLQKAADYSTDKGLMTSIYHNDNLRPDEPITLRVEGISALDKTKTKLIINTETKQIQKAPDDRLSFSGRTDEAEPGMLLLDFFTPLGDGLINADGSSFSVEDNFTDGSGSEHWLGSVYDNYYGYKEIRGDGRGSTTTSVFNVGREKLSQPLTFNIKSYPNLIIDSTTLQIR